MTVRLIGLYLGHDFIKAPFYLVQILQAPPESDRILAALNLWMEIIVTGSFFLFWILFIFWAADYLVHQKEMLVQNLMCTRAI